MAYIIGLLSNEEMVRLQKLGWKVERVQTRQLQTPLLTDPCPDCTGHLRLVNDDEIVCDDCSRIWVNAPMSMVYVDNDMFKIMTGVDWPTDNPWDNDLIQFARLISEINACVEIRAGDMDALLESTGLEDDELRQLFDRADRAWEKAKIVYAPPKPRPRGLDEAIAGLIADGLRDDEVVKNLYDVEPHDLVGVIRQLMSDDALFCAYCGQKIGDPETARFSQYNEPVCDDCRDKEAR